MVQLKSNRNSCSSSRFSPQHSKHSSTTRNNDRLLRELVRQATVLYQPSKIKAIKDRSESSVVRISNRHTISLVRTVRRSVAWTTARLQSNIPRLPRVCEPSANNHNPKNFCTLITTSLPPDYFRKYLNNFYHV